MKAAWISIFIITEGCYLSNADRGHIGDDVDTSDDDGGIPQETDDDGGIPQETDDDAIGEVRDEVPAADGGDVTELPCVDEDLDGHPSAECGGDDCNDGDPTVYPGAPDACGDGRDTNCDGLDSHGGVLGPPLLLLDHPKTGGNLYTALVWTGDEYLFLWRIHEGDGIFMRQVDDSGKVVGDQVLIHTYENAFDVAWNGSRLGSVWGAGEEGSMSIMFQAFDRFGNSLTDEVAVVTAASIGIDGGVCYGPRIIAAGEDFFVLWSEHHVEDGNADALVARIDQYGNMLAGPALVGPYSGGDAPKLDMAWSGAVLLPAWTTDVFDPGARAILLVRPFSRDVAPLGPAQTVTDRAGYSTLHQLLWDGAEFLSLWSAGHPYESDAQLFLSRLDTAGVEISQTAFSPPLYGEYQYLRPAVWGGDHIVILRDQYPDALQLTLNRYTLDGNLDGASIVVPVSSRPDRLYLVLTGTEFGFIWSEEDETTYRVWMQRAMFCD